MKYLTLVAILLVGNCTAFQTTKPAQAESSKRERPLVKSQEREVVKKLVSYITIITKPKSVRIKADSTKSFTYNIVLKSNAKAGTINLEIKPDGDKFKYTCKIVIETLSQEETVEFVSTDAAEVIRQLKVSLGGSADDND